MVNENYSSDISMKVIGSVHSVYKQKFGTPRQSGLVAQAQAIIELLPQFQPEQSLEGLSDFSHIWVLFWFHKSASTHFHAKVHPPRLAGKTMGVFASRSPDRPNPVGLSLVKLEKIENHKIFISGVDFIEGTPVLDVKPYLPQTEAVPTASAGWSAQVLDPEVVVEWDSSALQSLQEHNGNFLKDLIEATLKRDPRPLVYREPKPQYRDNHAIFVDNFDVHFKFENPQKIRIYRVLKI